MKTINQKIVLSLFIASLGLAGCSEAQKESTSETKAEMTEEMEEMKEETSDYLDDAKDEASDMMDDACEKASEI